MARKKDMTGQRCGRLIVLSESGRDSVGNVLWLCQCDCGKQTITSGDKLRSGNTTSCGCYMMERRQVMHITHGKCHTRIYRIWQNMLQRCQNEKAAKWNIYGGRGITVCDSWKIFQNFYDDMGDPPDGTTLDRIDSNGNYCKENCRWATNDVQSRNRSANRILKFGDKEQVVTDWGKELNIDPNTLCTRLDRGWSIERALTTPVRKCASHEL